MIRFPLISRGLRLAAVALTLATSCIAQTAAAQGSFPERPVTLVIPFAAGGATDVVGRLIGAEVAKTLGQPVVVETRVGAAGAIGAQHVARSAADGYTLCFCGGGPSLILKLLDPKLPYDPTTDLAPVTLTHTIDYIMVVNPSSPHKNLKDIVAAAKVKPDALSYGSTGLGGPAHLGMEYFNKMVGVKMVHVPYKGESQEILDLLGGGQLDVGILSLQIADPLIKSGKLRPIAVWGKERAKLFPQVPSVSEHYPGFEAGTFVGVMVAANTPKPVIDKLNRAFVSAVGNPDVKRKLIEMGFAPRGTSPAEFATFLKEERTKWSAVIQDLGLKGRE